MIQSGKYKNWLITGGCGFIGSQLVHRLIHMDCNIRIIDNLSVGHISLIPSPSSNLEVKIADITDGVLAHDMCEKIDVVVHLAANTGVPMSVAFPRSDCYSNVIGTLNYLIAAKNQGVKKFIFASSSSVLGDNDPPYIEDMLPKPISPYGASKLAGESYCNVFHYTHGLETIALRFSNVYGPGSKKKTNQLIPKTIYHMLNKENAEIFGDGHQTRDFTYIDDLLDVIFSCVNTDGLSGEIFQIATNIETSVDYIIKKLNSLCNEYLGHYVGIDFEDVRQGDVYKNFADITKARNLLNYTPKIGIDEGLEKTFKWFLENERR